LRTPSVNLTTTFAEQLLRWLKTNGGGQTEAPWVHPLNAIPFNFNRPAAIDAHAHGLFG
jgi:hypothetical protein